jgi:hypothetical protein
MKLIATSLNLSPSSIAFQLLKKNHLILHQLSLDVRTHQIPLKFTMAQESHFDSWAVDKLFIS